MLRDEIDDCAIGMRFCIDTLDEPYGYGDLGIRADEEGIQVIAALDDLRRLLGPQHRHAQLGRGRRLVALLRDQPRGRVHARSPRPSRPSRCVNVGRFTDPDVMVEVITSGQCDIIGAARPSIADPFLPKKIEEGRFDDIRECIGCNVCVSRWEIGARPDLVHPERHQRRGVPPRMAPGEVRPGANTRERRARRSAPARPGWSARVVLGERGMRRVHLVDAERKDMGGHLNWVTTLPGLGDWGAGHQLPQDPDRQARRTSSSSATRD